MDATSEIAITAYVVVCVLFICWLLRYLRSYIRPNSEEIEYDIHSPMV